MDSLMPPNAKNAQHTLLIKLVDHALIITSLPLQKPVNLANLHLLEVNVFAQIISFPARVVSNAVQ